MSLLTKTTWIIILSAIGSLCINESLPTAHGSTNGAPAGRTGSPGDVFNCTACHSGSATTVAGLITSNIPATGYVPGQTYTITGSITSIGKTKFGFQISPQDITGAELGTLVITDPTNTKLVGTSGNYATHSTAGSSFPSGIATWSFNWIAPIAGTGEVTFYGAFNITNNNNIASGDAIKLSTLIVQENVSASLNDIVSKPEAWNIYPNPSENIICLVNEDNSRLISLSIMDINGKLINTLIAEDISNNQNIDISDLQKGVYILTIASENGISTKRFIKN